MKEDTKQEALNSELAILPISSIASALNIHPRTLRIYDREGILSPKRTGKNRRNYSLDDLEKGKVILFLTRNLAMNLSGVKLVLSLLENTNTKPNEYMNYIQDMAKKAGIDSKAQKLNIEKTSKRGRKPSVLK